MLDSTAWVCRASEEPHFFLASFTRGSWPRSAPRCSELKLTFRIFFMEVEDRGVFEWVADWKTLGPRLSPAHLGLSPAARVIDVGCGTSTLPLHLASMYACVTGVDREEHCASSMTAQYGERDDLRWITCDVTAPELDASLLPYGCADLVVDKGMLDCALTEDIAAPLLCNVARLLSEGGVYAVISFRKVELLEPLLRCEALPWSVESEALPPSADGARVSLCLMRKCLAVDDASLPSSVAHHINATMDEWYMHEAPLLTAEREGALRESWSAAAASLRTAATAKGV